MSSPKLFAKFEGPHQIIRTFRIICINWLADEPTDLGPDVGTRQRAFRVVQSFTTNRIVVLVLLFTAYRQKKSKQPRRDYKTGKRLTYEEALNISKNYFTNFNILK